MRHLLWSRGTGPKPVTWRRTFGPAVLKDVNELARRPASGSRAEAHPPTGENDLVDDRFDGDTMH